MQASDYTQKALELLSDVHTSLTASEMNGPPAIPAVVAQRPLTEREVGWLQSFNQKMVDQGQEGMEVFLRKVSRQLRSHETRPSLAFRPLRFSNELPVMLQLAGAWRESTLRRLAWSNMLTRLVRSQIGRKLPPRDADDWSFLRDAWRLAGFMGLESGPAAAARNQIDTFARHNLSKSPDFIKLLGVVDKAVSDDAARSVSTDLSAIVAFRRRLAVEPGADNSNLVSLLRAWVASIRAGVEAERALHDDFWRFAASESRFGIVDEWIAFLGDTKLKAALTALDAGNEDVSVCWATVAELVLDEELDGVDAKNRLLSLQANMDCQRGYYEPTAALRKKLILGVS